MNARIIIMLLLLWVQPSHAQEIATSATCGKCGRVVSSASRVGDRCPYCHVVWNQENTSRNNKTIEPPKHNYGSSQSGYKASRTPLYYFKLKSSSTIYYRNYYGNEVGGLVYQQYRFAGTEIKDQYVFIRHSDEDGGAAIGWVKLSDLVMEDDGSEREIDYSELAQKIGEETYQEVIRKGRDPFESKFQAADPELSIPNLPTDTVSSNTLTQSTPSVSQHEKSIEQLAKEEGSRVYWSAMLRNFLFVIGGAIVIFLFQQGSKTKPS